MNYKKEQTIHQSGILDVEVDDYGSVVAVWYNCMQLPFKESTASPQRATEMVKATLKIDYEIVEIKTKKVDTVPENLNDVLRKVAQHYWTNGISSIGINKGRILIVVTNKDLVAAFPKVLDGVPIEIAWAK